MEMEIDLSINKRLRLMLIHDIYRPILLSVLQQREI